MALCCLEISESIRSFTSLPFPPLGVARIINLITCCTVRFLVAFCYALIVFLCHLRYQKVKFFNVHNDVSACCAHEGEPGTDESVHKSSLRT